MKWNDAIDNYCERTDPSVFSEPLNFISNIAFLIAAFALLKHYKSLKNINFLPGTSLLIALIGTIGIGSALFHSLATYGTMIADVAPITMFLLTYLWLYFRYRLKLSTPHSCYWMSGFIVLTAIAAQIISQEASNGSHLYIGAWVTLFGIACYSFVESRGHKIKWAFPSAFVIFTTSLFFRTIDMQICSEFPNGSHFAWHLLNAAVLYLITYEYLTFNRLNK